MQEADRTRKKTGKNEGNEPEDEMDEEGEVGKRQRVKWEGLRLWAGLAKMAPDTLCCLVPHTCPKPVQISQVLPDFPGLTA